MAKQRPTHVSKPTYPGGPTALRRFVRQQLSYPQAAREARVEGTVVVRYTLDYRGKVVDATVKKGIGHGCDEEALRVVRLLRYEVPQDRKKKVRIHQDINIHFRLPKTKKSNSPAPIAIGASAPTSVTYTITPQREKKPSGTSSYGYTIKW